MCACACACTCVFKLPVWKSNGLLQRNVIFSQGDGHHHLVILGQESHMRGSHSLLGRLPECCSWTCPQQKRKETWGLDLAAERCPSPGRHRPSSRLPAPRAPHTCSSNQGPGLPPPRCDLRRRNRPSCPTPALHSPDTALARAFLACFIHLQNSFLRPQKTRTVPPAHARSERARPASGRVLGMRRDRGETSCKQPSMRKKSNNW